MIRLLTVLCFCSICVAQEDYLVDLKLTIREEKIPAVVNYLLNNSLESLQITTKDIIQLSKLDKIDENGLIEVFQFYNISEVYTIDNLEQLLKTLNITFGDFYKTLTTDLSLNATEQQAILNSLKISNDFWVSLVIGVPDIYEVLRKGTYNEETTSEALKICGKSASEVFAVARTIIQERVEAKSSQEFMSILKSVGWNKQSALNFYKALNLTTRDVYQVEKFREIFTNISNSLNKFTTLGIFIAADKIALHKFAYKNLLEIVDVSYVKVEAGQNEIIFSKIDDLGENIIELAAAIPTSNYIEVVESYNSTGNCSYVTISNGVVSTFDVEVDNFVVEKTPQMDFLLGAPLVCNNLLYALAREENGTTIVFDGFYTEDMPEIVNSFSPKATICSVILIVSFFICFVDL